MFFGQHMLQSQMPDFYTESLTDDKANPVLRSPNHSPMLTHEKKPQYFGTINTRQLGAVNLQNQAPLSFMQLHY